MIASLSNCLVHLFKSRRKVVSIEEILGIECRFLKYSLISPALSITYPPPSVIDTLFAVLEEASYVFCFYNIPLGEEHQAHSSRFPLF